MPVWRAVAASCCPGRARGAPAGGRGGVVEGDGRVRGGSGRGKPGREEKGGGRGGAGGTLRDPSASRTIAGAAVVDPFGPPRNRRTPRRLAELRALRQPNA